MKRKELVATLTAYCNDVGIPIVNPLGIGGNFDYYDYGFIPFSTDKIGEAFENDRWVSSLAGDEGEFGKNEEYFVGSRAYYVRRNERVVSYLNESSGNGYHFNGFVVFINDYV